MNALGFFRFNTPDPEELDGDDGNNTLVGGGGDDTLRGFGGNDSLDGGDGRDRLEGGEGDDTLDASGGSAETQGFGDYIRPGLGADTILGHEAHWNTGEGADVSYGDLSGIGGLTINIGANGTGTAVSGTPGLVNDSFTYIHYFEGSLDGDLINGSDEDVWFGYAPLGGADTVNGGDGWDMLTYSYEADYFGGVGSGIVVDWAAGTVVDTQGDTDSFSGIDEIRGSQMDDLMDASGATQRVELRGEDGNDTILGGSGDDRLFDGGGDDSVDGGAGNDTIFAGSGMDTFIGGEGRDRIEIDLRETAADAFTAIVDLAAGEIYALEFPDNNPDVISGIEDVRLRGSVDARITGDDNDNELRTDAGDDTLIGGGGRDSLVGGAGNDLLDASGGSAESHFTGDFVRPGLGQDTVLGHEGVWAANEGVHVAYGDVSGVGGLTVTIGANGTGTAVSGTAGLVDDTFTYAHYFTGSGDGDLYTGNDEDQFQGFSGLAGDDTINAGGGYDELAYDFEHLWYDGAGSGITVDWAAGTVTDTQGDTDSFTGIERIRGSVFDDEIDASGMTTGIEARGEDGNDTLIGGAGDDRLKGDGGTDTAVINVNQADATISTEGDVTIVDSAQGRDELQGIEFIQFLDGTVNLGGPVTLIGDEGANELTGNEGDDSIFGLAGDDTLDGAGGDDNIGAADGNDVVTGGEGNDFLGGGPGNDNVDGGEGNDIVAGGSGNDTVSGGAGDGDDGVYGGAGDDLLDGGDGDDIMGASIGKDTINGGAGNDDIGGGAGQDSIDAGSGNDSVGGGEANDVIFGRGGNDFLAGGGRDDTIQGGNGDDTINGGDGDDVMSGGAGADVFVFNFFKDGDADVITDFEDGIDLFRIRIVNPADGTPNISNNDNGKQGYVDALNITDVAGGAQLEVGEHRVLIEGVSAADLTTADFDFI